MATSIINGSFEVPDVSVDLSASVPPIEDKSFINGQVKTYLKTAPGIGWSTTDKAIEIWRYPAKGPTFKAYDGKQWAEINAYIFGLSARI